MLCEIGGLDETPQTLCVLTWCKTLQDQGVTNVHHCYNYFFFNSHPEEIENIIHLVPLGCSDHDLLAWNYVYYYRLASQRDSNILPTVGLA